MQCSPWANIATLQSTAWAISLNLSWKIQSCSIWLKIGTLGILEVLIPNLDVDFWNSNPKILFWAKLGQKSQSCSYCLKIGTRSVSRMLILTPILISQFLTLNPFLGKISPASGTLCFAWCSYTSYLKGVDLLHLKSVTKEDHEGGL